MRVDVTILLEDSFFAPIPAFILESNAFRNDWNWTSSLEIISIYRIGPIITKMSRQFCWNVVQQVRWVRFSIWSYSFQCKSCQPIINLFHGGGLEIKRDRVTYIHLVGFQFDYCGVQPRLGKRWLTTMHFVEFSVGFSLSLCSILFIAVGFSNLVRWSLSSPKYSDIKSFLLALVA